MTKFLFEIPVYGEAKYYLREVEAPDRQTAEKLVMQRFHAEADHGEPSDELDAYVGQPEMLSPDDPLVEEDE